MTAGKHFNVKLFKFIDIIYIYAVYSFLNEYAPNFIGPRYSPTRKTIFPLLCMSNKNHLQHK